MASPKNTPVSPTALGEDVRGQSVWRAAEMAVEAVVSLTEEVEIPSLQELGFTHPEIPVLADIAFNDPQTIGNPRDLSRESYVEIYQLAFELGTWTRPNRQLARSAWNRLWP